MRIKVFGSTEHPNHSGEVSIGLLSALFWPFLFAVVAPFFFVVGGIKDPSAFDVAVQTSVYVAVCILLSVVTTRNMTNLPGISGDFFILPCLLISFLIMFMLLLLSRVDYSRALVTSGTLISLTWFAALLVVGKRARDMRVGIAPFGEIGTVRDIGGVHWVSLDGREGELAGLSAVVADLRADISDEWDRLLADYALSGVPVYHVKLFKESLTGTVELEHLSENTFGSLMPMRSYAQVKRIVDWLAAAAGLLVLSPFLILAALAVKLDSNGPALFSQVRIGYRGKPFTVYKFRTMQLGSDQDDDARNAAQTKANDNRITKLGRFYRKTRIDELPQLVNILRGEMSFIGPRPEAEVLSEWYRNQIPFYRYRHVVVPGITGWAQVNQGHVSDIEGVQGKLSYDFYYIKYFSPWLDVLIVAKTIQTVITGKGHK